MRSHFVEMMEPAKAAPESAVPTPAHQPGTACAKRGAFTLVELLVVIGIIAVLIGLLMPALSAARKQAQMVACGSNLRQVYMGMRFYMNDFKGWIPAPITQITNTTGGSTLRPTWNQFLHQYGTYDSAPWGNWKAPQNYISSAKVFECPTQDTPNPDRGSYGLNSRMGTDAAGVGQWNFTFSWDTSNGFYRLQRTRHPTEIYLVGDSVAPNYTLLMVPSSGTTPDFRHKKRTNMLFHDGHVESLTYADVRAEPTYYGKSPWVNR